MKIGSFYHNLKYSKAHIVKPDGSTICGFIPEEKSSFQMWSPSTSFKLIKKDAHCEDCKRIINEVSKNNFGAINKDSL